MKKTLQITISGPAKSGKTATAVAVAKMLSKFGVVTKVEDTDGPHHLELFENRAEETLKKLGAEGLTVIIKS